MEKPLPFAGGGKPAGPEETAERTYSKSDVIGKLSALTTPESDKEKLWSTSQVRMALVGAEALAEAILDDLAPDEARPMLIRNIVLAVVESLADDVKAKREAKGRGLL